MDIERIETNTIYLGDCLDIMQRIPAGSVDMVLCDLPYGMTEHRWDNKIDLSRLWSEYLIRTYTNPHDVVLDNCIGSGTTAEACINTGREYIGIEKDEEIYKIALERVRNVNNKRLCKDKH